MYFQYFIVLGRCCLSSNLHGHFSYIIQRYITSITEQASFSNLRNLRLIPTEKVILLFISCLYLCA